MNPIDGILLADKPQDWTSHDVCAFVRKRFKIKKVGHAGTLDPLATGLLVLLLGDATKKSNSFSASDKEYAGIMELGVKTDSHDKKGAVLANAPYSNITLAQIREAAKAFTGEITQVPPMVSALKHQGVRLYKLARKGVEVPRESRPITVHRFDIDNMDGAFVRFSCHVTKGTYVRTLVNDLGEALGCYASLSELRRTRSGAFSIEDSVTLEQLRQWTDQEIREKVLSIQTRYANLCRD
jgi:tRNA pseudouridine55 synthase